MDNNFYLLSGILIEKCSFQVCCQFNAKLGAIDQSIAIELLATLELFYANMLIRLIKNNRKNIEIAATSQF